MTARRAAAWALPSALRASRTREAKGDIQNGRRHLANGADLQNTETEHARRLYPDGALGRSAHVMPGAGYAGSRSSRAWDHVLKEHTARYIYRTLEQLVSNWLCHGRCYVPCRTSAVLIYSAL